MSWYLFHQKGISTQDFLSALNKFELTTIALSVFLFSLQNFFMALRLWVLFPKTERVGLGTVIHGVFFGQAVNTFFPARAGDVLKVVIFSRSGSTAATTATGVIIADKIIDLSALVVLILLSRSFVHGSQQLAFPVSFKGIMLLFTAFLGSLFLLRFLFRSRLKQLDLWWTGFKMGLLGILDIRRALLAFLFGIATWSCEALTLACLSQAQSFPISFSQGVFLLSILNLAISIPISLGNLGPFEAALSFGLEKLGASGPMAIALAAFYHFLQMATLLGLSGLVALVRMIPSFGKR